MAIIYGTPRNDRRDGTGDDDEIYGLAGADRLRGLDGDDLIEGGDGVDELVGGNGADRLFGGAGVDRLRGDRGDDQLDGGDGVDVAIFTGNASDYEITRANGVTTVRDLRNADTDTLVNVERARFGDGTLLDLTANGAPDATDDMGAVGEDGVLAGASVLSNDSDPDSNPLQVSAVNGAAAVGTTITLASGARLTVQADGTYSYDTNGAFNGLAQGAATTDGFSYTVSDGFGGFDTAGVSITINGVNDAPTAPATNAVTTDEDTASTAVAIGASDPDSGDTLAYSVKPGSEPGKGSVSFNQAAGTFTFTPIANTDGADTFTILVSDGAGATTEQVVSVTITPVAEPEAPILLADIAAGIGGFKIFGEEDFDLAGRSVSGAGDVNGDGLADLLVGADGAEGEDEQTGAAYLVFGKAGGAAVDLAAVAAGTGGFKIVAEGGGDFAGISVSGAGDVDGDGRPDLILGASGNDAGASSSGAAYVVFGKPNGLLVDLDNVAAGAGGFKISGEAEFDIAGRSVSGIGDVNGDGRADLIVGAPFNDSGGGFSGAAYVVFGKAGGVPVDLDAVAAGSGGFRIVGEAASDFAAFSVSGAGDVNGDGRPDLVVGASGNGAGGDNAGAAYVVFGKTDGAAVDLDAVAAGTGGFKIVGEAAGDQAGFAVSDAGDVNGDGLADLIVGAYRNAAGGDFSGAAYVVFGKASGGAVDLDAVAAGTGGFKIVGQAANDLAGFSVSAAGDVNGDGLADLLVGANGNGGRGAAYLVFGKADGAVVDLDAVAAGTGGRKFVGETAGDEAGISVAAAGDVNGDGRADLAVGAYFNSSDGEDSNGAAYVVFGSADWLI